MLPYVATGILSGAAYALFAMAFVLVYRGTRTFNLALGEIGGAGVYVAWALTPSIPVVAASLVGIGTAVVLALVIERLVARRIAEHAPIAGVAATLGVALVLAQGEARLWGVNVKTFPSPVGTAVIDVGSVTTTAPRVAALAAALLAAIGLGVLLRSTRVGLAMRAATSDTELARVSGVPVGRTRAASWALAGGLAGVSAILLAAIYTFHPLSNTFVLVKALAAVLLGGLYSLRGALVGGLAVGVLESVVIWGTDVPGMADAAVLVLILATLLLRPTRVTDAVA